MGGVYTMHVEMRNVQKVLVGKSERKKPFGTPGFRYEGVSKSFRTESIKKYMLMTIKIRREATQRVMVTKLTRLTHKIAIQLHLVAESCTICSSRSRRRVRKLLDTPSLC
jgi:hypothetical protein